MNLYLVVRAPYEGQHTEMPDRGESTAVVVVAADENCARWVATEVGMTGTLWRDAVVSLLGPLADDLDDLADHERVVLANTQQDWPERY